MPDSGSGEGITANYFADRNENIEEKREGRMEYEKNKNNLHDWAIK